MPVLFDQLILGDRYERPVLASIWGYRDWHAIGRGVVTPANDNKIILFITKQKQDAQTQYQDHFSGDLLHIDGETNHANDDRLINASAAGDEVHLFYREQHHTPFIYYGEIQLIQFERNSDRSSKFVFTTKREEVTSWNALLTEQVTHGDVGDFVPDEEGRRRLRLHVTYERSRRNRARAIEIHGTVCFACGFNFNDFYGSDISRDYIEIHHRKSIAEVDGPVDPETDLVPLCSNCHSMVHRERIRIMPVEELKGLIDSRRPWKMK